MAPQGRHALVEVRGGHAFLPTSLPLSLQRHVYQGFYYDYDLQLGLQNAIDDLHTLSLFHFPRPAYSLHSSVLFQSLATLSSLVHMPGGGLVAGEQRASLGCGV